MEIGVDYIKQVDPPSTPSIPLNKNSIIITLIPHQINSNSSIIKYSATENIKPIPHINLPINTTSSNMLRNKIRSLTKSFLIINLFISNWIIKCDWLRIRFSFWVWDLALVGCRLLLIMQFPFNSQFTNHSNHLLIKPNPSHKCQNQYRLLKKPKKNLEM